MKQHDHNFSVNEHQQLMYWCICIGVLLDLNFGDNALINWNPDPPPPPTPPQAYVGQCGGFLWYLKAWLARGCGGFLRICLAYSWQSGSEVGIWLVPSFLTVISLRDHWYFDVLLGRTCFEVIGLSKLSFLIVFPFISWSFFTWINPLRFYLELSWFVDWKLLLLFKTSQTMQIHAPLLIIKGAVSRLSGSFC